MTFYLSFESYTVTLLTGDITRVVNSEPWHQSCSHQLPSEQMIQQVAFHRKAAKIISLCRSYLHF